MSSFNARLRMPGSRLPLGVEVDIVNERMTVASGDSEVASWPLERLDVTLRSDGFHIRVDGEELVLAVPETKSFAAALGMSDKTPGPVTPSRQLAAKAESNDLELAALRRRISDLARDLTSETVAPDDVFGRWLRLLKELNRLNADGALPSRLFTQLNTHLLELIPAPATTPL
jgi:hypothetical protein